ncbi:MAG: hypothetical protein IT422_06120 [Pirellulaceae bacterium]|nr:hypothetical protein [Pirellulaceae bacterium]
MKTVNNRKLLPIAVILLGCVAVFWWSVSLALQIALATVLIVVLLVLTLQVANKMDEAQPPPKTLETLLELAKDREVSRIHDEIAESLKQIAAKQDPIFRRLALQKLQGVADQCQRLANDTIEFSSTEAWRIVYEELLRSPGLHLYRSVSYVESAHYWQDGPGQQSTRLNLELHDNREISIERTAIIADHLWPDLSVFPVEPIHAWLEEQHRHGIWIRLVRESKIRDEADLLADFGIYGSRAVGIQIADPAGRTLRFQLSFDFDKVLRAEAIWNRLAVYAISYRELLDQKH